MNRDRVNERAKEWYWEHRDEVRRRARERYRADPEAIAKKVEQNFMYRHGITRGERDALLAEQGGRCAICGTDDPGTKGFHLDHDHTCCPASRSCARCRRGVLCSPCNVMLGMAGDQTDRLQAAINYLDKFRSI